MATLNDWLDEILEQADGCLAEIALRTLERKAKEFFRDTFAWQQWLDGFDVTPGTGVDVSAGAPSGTEIVQILSARFLDSNSKKYVLFPVPYEPVPLPDPVDYPREFYLSENTTLHVLPDIKTAKTGVLDVYCALQPVDRNTTLPDFVDQKYHDVLLWGVLGELFASPGKPYSNPDHAKLNLRRFNHMKSRIRDEVRRKFSMADTWFKFPSRGWGTPTFVKRRTSY